NQLFILICILTRIRVPEEVKHTANIRMCHTLRQVYFPLETLQTVRIPGRDLRPHHLQGDMLVQLQVLSFIDLTHAATCEKLHYAETSGKEVARRLQWAAALADLFSSLKR